MAGQKQMAAKMADEYVLKIPSVTFPEDSPQWVTTVFPALIKSIYDLSFSICINDIVNSTSKFNFLMYAELYILI